MNESMKCVLITGASSGIGLSLMRQFATKGYTMVAVADNESRLLRACASLAEETGANIMPITTDLTDPEAAGELKALLDQRGVTVDILVNDAGIAQRELFHQGSLENDIAIIRLNVEALTRMTKLFLRDMVARNDGKILNLGSIAGFQPGPFLAVYHATKAYVVSFSEAIAEELKDTGVSVTVLCPGPTDTDFFRRADMENVQILEKGIVMDPDAVARIGYEALMNGERVVIPGISNKVMTFTRRLIPQSLQAKMNKKFYEVKDDETHLLPG